MSDEYSRVGREALIERLRAWEAFRTQVTGRLALYQRNHAVHQTEATKARCDVAGLILDSMPLASDPNTVVVTAGSRIEAGQMVSIKDGFALAITPPQVRVLKVEVDETIAAGAAVMVGLDGKLRPATTSGSVFALAGENLAKGAWAAFDSKGKLWEVPAPEREPGKGKDL